MNWVVVLNIGDVLCPNARESIQSAALRWGCGFAELTERLNPHQDAAWDKYGNIVRFICSRSVDRVLYLDADILIRSDAPSPFELFTDIHALYAVLDYQPSYGKDEAALWHSEIAAKRFEVIHPWFNWPDVVTGRFEDWFFNAGVFLFWPASFRTEMELFLAHIPAEWTTGLVEQAMWNYLVKKRTVLVDRTWNQIMPDISGAMKQYAYHFTGFHKERVRPQLKTYNWYV